MFNDVGVVAAVDMNEHGKPQPGFRVYVAGGLGANPHAALASEDFTPREDLLPTIEAILRVFDQAGNRDIRLRARMKWLVDTLVLCPQTFVGFESGKSPEFKGFDTCVSAQTFAATALVS